MKKQDIIDLLEQETERYEKIIKTIESYIDDGDEQIKKAKNDTICQFSLFSWYIDRLISKIQKMED